MLSTEQIIFELTQRERYLSMLVEVQKYLLASATDHWPDYILPILGTTTESSRATFHQNHFNSEGELVVSLMGEWCAPDIPPTLNDPRFQQVRYSDFSPYWLEHLKKDSSLVVPTAATPDKERALLESLQIVSFILLPIMAHHKLLGFISLSDCAQLRVWSDVEIDMLWTVIASMSLYLERVEAELALQSANEKLHQLANLDGVTEIANRRRFDHHLNLEWERLEVTQASLSLIMCDIDYFKQYNDTYGHLAGDECLRQVAQTLANVVSGPHDLVARYGGEEFAIILSDTNINGAIQIAQTIKATVYALQIPHTSSSVAAHVTVSMGISALTPDPNLSPETLVAMADAALYKAKMVGRNCIAI